MRKSVLDFSEIDLDILQQLCGFQDKNLARIEKELGVQLVLKGDKLQLSAENEEQENLAIEAVKACIDCIEEHNFLDANEAGRICYRLKKGENPKREEVQVKPLVRTREGKWILPRTPNQKKLARALNECEIVFATGVAGTGKTYLSVAWAVGLLKNEEIEKIILTRPAVEAGESLGFLPGDMKEKVDPYLRPLYDALNEFLGADTVERLIEKQVIEIAPLAFMRGRTLSKAAVILDEAQNTTKSQMKMFLTRMGDQCRMVINGDISQTDLVARKDSGLQDALNRLKDIDGIGQVFLSAADVIRHPLVAKIIERYEEEADQGALNGQDQNKNTKKSDV